MQLSHDKNLTFQLASALTPLPLGISLRIPLTPRIFWHQRSLENARVLADGLSPLPGLRVPLPEPHMEHAWYKFYAFVRPEELRAGWTRDRIAQTLQDMGIPCLHGGCSEVYLEKAFDGGFRPRERLPVAKELGETSLMFLVHPTLEGEHMERVVQAVGEVMERACK